MIAMTVPKVVRTIADKYKDLAPDQSYTNLCGWIIYFLFRNESTSELSRIAPCCHSVSELCRSAKLFPTNRFIKRARSSVLRHYNGKISEENFTFVIDDTANPKYSKNCFKSGYWHGSSGPWFGQKAMILSLVDMNRGISIPLAYAFASKEGDPDYKKGSDLAVELLSVVLEEGFPKLSVVFDSWFDSSELMEKVEAMGLTYVGELKSNRSVKINPNPHSKWGKLSKSFKKLPRKRAYTRFDSAKIKKRQKKSKVFSEQYLYIRKRKSPLKAIAVYNRLNGKKAFGYFVSTDLSMSGARIWELSRARWKIEVMFRDLKQNLSFGRLPSAGKENADLAVCIPMIILMNFRLFPEKNGIDTHKSIGDMVDQIREISLQRSIDFLILRENPQIINKFKARRHLKRMNKKPVDHIVEAA